MKLSRINAISGDIVCAQQRDTRVVKKKQKKKKWPVPIVQGVGWGGLEDVKDQLLFPDTSELSKPLFDAASCTRCKQERKTRNVFFGSIRNKIQAYMQELPKGGGGSGTLE